MKACRCLTGQLIIMNMGRDSPDRNGRWGQDSYMRDSERTGYLRLKDCRWVAGQLRNMDRGQDSLDRSGSHEDRIVSYER